MDLRNLTTERLQEMIKINEKKQLTYAKLYGAKALNDLLEIRVKLEKALAYKMTNPNK